jgi:predicted aspartyl protease
MLSSDAGRGVCTAFLLFAAMALSHASELGGDPSAAAPITQPADDVPLYAAPTTTDGVGRIMAPVMVNGAGPFLFIVDTGATRGALSPRLVARLGLDPSMESPLTVQGSTGSLSVPSVVVDRLQAGDIVLEHRRLPVVAPAVFADADGILGVEGLDKMRISVDFGMDRIRISRHRDSRPAGNWYRVPVQLRFGRLMIAKARVGEIAVDAVIDTGAERTLGNLALRKALGLDQAARAKDTESTVVGATVVEYDANTIASPRILLGDTSLVSVDITFADLHIFRVWDLLERPAIVVGMDVLGTARALLFDYRRKELMIRLEGGGLLLRKENG